MSFTYWASGKPDNGGPAPGEDYVHLFEPSREAAGRWNDMVNDRPDSTHYPFYGVVEIP